MNVIGYTDRLSVRPGDQVQVKVSCEREHYDAELVLLDRAFMTPHADGRTSTPIPHPLNGGHRGREQGINAGSCMIVRDGEALAFAEGFTFAAWIFPTFLSRGGAEQGVAAEWSESGISGFALLFDEDGHLVLRIGDGLGVGDLRSPGPLTAKRWWFVAATHDGLTGAATMSWRERPRSWVGGDDGSIAVDRVLRKSNSAPVFLAALHRDAQGWIHGHFNGKIDRPGLWERALSPAEIDSLRAEAVQPADIPGAVADWAMDADFASRTVADRSGRGRHGDLVNLPTRCVTGADWTGVQTSPVPGSGGYGAIHFHEDDLEDARWETDFSFRVPDDLRSGVYAVKLTAGESSDHVPFYVRPARGKPTASVLFLAPTNTYLAYGNERLFRWAQTNPEFLEKQTDHEVTLTERDMFLEAHPEYGSSTYDLHPDGGGTVHSSRLRPLISMRPEFINFINGDPRHFAGDLFLVEWMEKMGIACDVATDEDVHLEGADAFSPYKVVVTGSHPEYWTAAMMRAIEGYLAGGGRMMYLGGNGFYWVTGMDAANPHVIEVRRGYNGTRAWESAAGEGHLATEGAPGGLWRYRGRNPNVLTGVGFASQGWGGAAPYARLPASFDRRAAWIFEGVGADELIGDFGLCMDGAAGDEIDRHDPAFGTPPETMRLATSEGRHSNYYQLVMEDNTMTMPGRGGREDPRVRADITLLETANGGAVFSVGSICWSASLPVNGFANNVSRITENVLRRFMV